MDAFGYGVAATLTMIVVFFRLSWRFGAPRVEPEPKTPLAATIRLLRDPQIIWKYTPDCLYITHAQLAVPPQNNCPGIYRVGPDGTGHLIVPWSHVHGADENRLREAIQLAAARAVIVRKRPKPVKELEEENDLFTELLNGP